MNSIAIVTTLANSQMLGRCIRSILESDYTGDVVVTSCMPEVEYVADISDRVHFSYQPGNGTDNPKWGLHSNCIMSLGREYHDLIMIHDDAILPNYWYNNLVKAWDMVEDCAWSISLPHVEHNVGNSYLDYICAHSYEDIINMYRAAEKVYPIQTTNPDQLLGLGVDSWNRYSGITPTGRLSPCFSVLHRVWTEAVNKYGGENCFVMELFMLHDMIKERRWCLFLNNAPLIHYRKPDDGKSDSGQGHAACFRKWHGIFGYNLSHLLTVFSSMVTVEYREEIITAINEGRTADIEYLFSEMEELIANRDCSKCAGLSVCMCRGTVNNIGWGQ
jgi:hypothetical protein